MRPGYPTEFDLNQFMMDELGDDGSREASNEEMSDFLDELADSDEE